MSRHSYIVVPADKASIMAEKTLAWVKDQRARQIRAHLLARARRLNSRWYRRLLRLAPVTPDQVEASERQDYSPMWSDLYAIEHFYWAEAQDLASKVLRAASTGEPFHFTLDDFSLLFRAQ